MSSFGQGITITLIRIEILKALRDKKIRRLHEIHDIVGKRLKISNIEKLRKYTDSHPSSKHSDTRWLKRIKFELHWAKKYGFITNPRKFVFTKKELKDQKFGGELGKFCITESGLEVLKLCISYKKQMCG